MIPRLVATQVAETANDNIVSIVGDYVKLRRRGSGFVGCCPFHNEKTPSFSVSPAKGFFHCFGCGKSGSAVTFVMEMERVGYPDALRLLGNRLGIAVPEEVASPEEEREARERDSVFAVLEYAARAFEENLRSSDEGQGLGMTYWRSRGFRDDTIAKFRLGYALSRPDALMGKALADGYKMEALVKAGLVAGKELNDPHRDYFRGRVMFPIQNTTGKVIGFGGRVLDAATKGVSIKYLNTPETEFYNKRDTLYGIYQARAEISRMDKCYLVEGYTDVISMHQCGVANVVASSGTSLTASQVRLLKRFTSNITILYDGDKAGIHASLRGIDMILREGLNVRVLLLPDDDDPDSFARKHSADDFLAYVEGNEKDFLAYEAQVLMASAGDDPIKKAEATHTIIASIAEVQDSVARELYVRECAKTMRLSEETVYAALQKRLVDNAARQRDQDVAEQRRRAYEEARAAQTPPALPSPEGRPPLPPTPPLSPQAPPAEALTLSQQDVAMAEVMRLFVTYPQAPIEQMEGRPTVAQFIAETLADDNIAPTNPVFGKILDEYRNAPDPAAVDTRHFMSMPDADVSRFVAEALGRPQESRIHSRYAVVKSEEESLDAFVQRALFELMFPEVVRKGDELRRELAEKSAAGAVSDEELDGILADIAKYDRVKTLLSVRQLGERAVF